MRERQDLEAEAGDKEVEEGHWVVEDILNKGESPFSIIS